LPLVGYPSSDFPPPPRFSLSIPEGWQAAWPVGTLLAVHGLPDKDGVQPNVLVAHNRLPATASFHDALERAMEQLRQATPVRELAPARRLEIDHALDAALLAASFLTEDSVQVLQRQILLQVESAGLGTAVLEITATCSASDIDQIQTIFDSFEFAPTSSDSLLPDAAP
jgi:hypothetical protein